MRRTGRTVAIVPMRSPDALATLTIAGEPVIVHTLRALRAVREIDAIVLAPEGIDERRCLQGIGESDRRGLKVSIPGASRWHAIRAALETAAAADRVLIQEPDHPLVSAVGLSRLLVESRAFPAVVSATPVHSSIKRVVDGRIVSTVPRELLQAAQSPWVFDRGVLEEALDAAIAFGWPATHETELVRQAGISLHLAAGDLYNVPIASRADARFAELAVERRLVSVPVLAVLRA